MKINEVLNKREQMAIEKFLEDTFISQTVKKALLLAFYFKGLDAKNLEQAFSELENLDEKEKLGNKRSNPAI